MKKSTAFVIALATWFLVPRPSHADESFMLSVATNASPIEELTGAAPWSLNMRLGYLLTEHLILDGGVDFTRHSRHYEETYKYASGDEHKSTRTYTLSFYALHLGLKALFTPRQAEDVSTYLQVSLFGTIPVADSEYG